MTAPGFVSVSEAAERAGVHRNTVCAMCQDGRLPAFRLPGFRDWHIPEHAIPTIPDLASRERTRVIRGLLANLERQGVHIPHDNGDPEEAA